MPKVKVRILVSIASADWSYYPGQEVEMDEEMARNWIKGGNAAPIADAVETATAEPRETRPARKRGGR